MVQLSSIEWCDRTSNPLRARRRDNGKVGWHCVKWSSGCAHCYAEAINLRFGTGLPFTAHSSDLVELFLNPKELDAILSLRKPSKIFLGDMTDLFQELVTDELLDQVFAVMALAGRQSFQVLTKRPDRMADYLDGLSADPADRLADAIYGLGYEDEAACAVANVVNGFASNGSADGNPLDGTVKRWPLPNVWLGTSLENQKAAVERIPHLLRCPAAVRFLSVEPLLGPVDINDVSRTPGAGDDVTEEDDADGPPLGGLDGIGWVIVGGESGRDARPMHPDWARAIRDQCVENDVPFFFKQWGEWAPIGPFSGLTLEQDNGERHWFKDEGGVIVTRVGKKAAGRILDGRTWDEFPGVADA